MNAHAMVITSVEMFEDGLIAKERALTRIAPMLLEQLLVPTLDPAHQVKPLAQGLPASPAQHPAGSCSTPTPPSNAPRWARK